jgi:hypothetical protein
VATFAECMAEFGEILADEAIRIATEKSKATE